MRKNIKKNSIILIVLLILILLMGCSNSKNTSAEKVQTFTVIDCIGREVEIPQEVNRVACTYTVTGHIVTMLGDGDKIVAVSNGLRRDKLLHKISPNIKDASLVKVNGSLNIEELLNCNVDVVFLAGDMAHDKKETAKLEKFDIPYLVVDFKSIEEQQYLVSMIGKVLDREEEAAEYNNFYNQIIETVSERTQKIPNEERLIIYHSINEATCTVAENTLPAEWMKIAGAIDVSLGEDLIFDGDKYYANLEQILMWNPEVILCNEDGVDQYIREKDQWQCIDAVKNDKVFLLPVGISRWGHTTSIETPLAIAWVSNLLYPQYCSDIDVEGLTKEFYQKFFEYQLNSEEVEQLMSGKDMRLSKELED